MAPKKAFTLIEMMIVVAIIAILAMIAVAQYTRYIEKSRNSAALTLLQNLALAQFATQTPPYAESLGFQTINGVSPADFNSIGKLTDFGFRPDAQVGFATISPVPATQDDFVIIASYIAVGAPIFIYSNATKTGVHQYEPASIYAAVIPAQIYIYSWHAATGAAAIGHLTLDAANGLVSSVSIY